jgi:crotonobetainyl-CoA:carnitine CoA-transferase CaiB-like acyl-CoA transferase
LARNADIVLENFLAPSAQKLGLSPAQLFNVNPRLILCSISGFGRTGPMAGLPGYDFAIQAMSGLLSITGPVGGPPSKVGVAITDVLTGVYAATVVLACLHARQTSGHGYAVDLALLDCAIASQVNVVQAYLARLDAGESPEQANPQPQGNAHLQIVPYQLFATADAHLVVAVGNDEQWRRFAEAVMVELRDDARFATNPDRVRNRAVLIPLLEERMKTKTTAEWIARLEPLSVPHAPLWRYSELFAQEQATARNWRVTVRDPKGQPVDLVGSPFHISTPHSSSQQQEPSYAMPPEVGQHTEEVLREWAGFKLEDLAKLRSSGVIA